MHDRGTIPFRCTKRSIESEASSLFEKKLDSYRHSLYLSPHEQRYDYSGTRSIYKRY
jgi:hypothetical protein